MNKKKSLSEVDLYFLYGNAGEKSNEEIARALNCNLEEVEKHVEIALKHKEKEVPQKQQKTKTEPLSRKLFARKPERGFIGMTQAASEAGDDFRETHGNSVGVKGNEEHIHRPFGDSEPSR